MPVIPVRIHIDRISTTAIGEFKGAKVRAGFLWSAAGAKTSGKKQADAKKSQWTPFVELKTVQPNGGPSMAEASMRNCLLCHSTSSDVREALTVIIEKEGFFSNSTVCSISLDTHELFYAGTLEGPIVGQSDKGAAWRVACRLMVAEENGRSVAGPPVAPPAVAAAKAAVPSDGLAALPPAQMGASADAHRPMGDAGPPKLVLPEALRAMGATDAGKGAAVPPKKEHHLPIRRKPAAGGTSSSAADGGSGSKAAQAPPPHDAASDDALMMRRSVSKAIAALGFPPYVAAKVYVRPLTAEQQRQQQLGRQQHRHLLDALQSAPHTPVDAAVGSRLAAIVLAPQRDGALTEDDLEMLMDTFSVPLGHSVVVTVGANATVRSSLWRPELAAELNTAGQGFATNAKADAGSQTGDVSQLRSRTVTPHPTSAAALAARNSAQERLENTEAFQQAKQAIAEANRRESLAVAEAAKLRHALARVSQELETLHQERRSNVDDGGASQYGATSAGGSRHTHKHHNPYLGRSVWAALSSPSDHGRSDHGTRAVSPASLDGYVRWTSPGPLTVSPWSVSKQQDIASPSLHHNPTSMASDHRIGIRSPRSYASFSDDDASL